MTDKSTSRPTYTYPVDVAITTYRRVWIVARKHDEAEEVAERIVDQLNDEGRSRLPRSPAAPDDLIEVTDAADPVHGLTDPFATFAWWVAIEA